MVSQRRATHIRPNKVEKERRLRILELSKRKPLDFWFLKIDLNRAKPVTIVFNGISSITIGKNKERLLMRRGFTNSKFSMKFILSNFNVIKKIDLEKFT